MGSGRRCFILRIDDDDEGIEQRTMIEVKTMTTTTTVMKKQKSLNELVRELLVLEYRRFVLSIIRKN